MTGMVLFRLPGIRSAATGNATTNVTEHIISTGSFHIAITANPTVFAGSGNNDSFFITPTAYAQFLGKATEIARGDFVVIDG